MDVAQYVLTKARDSPGGEEEWRDALADNVGAIDHVVRAAHLDFLWLADDEDEDEQRQYDIEEAQWEEKK